MNGIHSRLVMILCTRCFEDNDDDDAFWTYCSLDNPEEVIYKLPVVVMPTVVVWQDEVKM